MDGCGRSAPTTIHQDHSDRIPVLFSCLDGLEDIPMPDRVEIWEKPAAPEVYMLAGWRQWADAGSVSSGLPQYLIQQTGARKIGQIRPDGFYLFQIPGTHDLV